MNDELSFIIILLVLLLYLVVGIYPRKSSDRETYLISSRKLNGIDNGLSIGSSKVGGGLLVVYSSFFFHYGWPAFAYFLGIILGYILFYKFAVKLRRESSDKKLYTVADYFRVRYGNRAGVIAGALTTISVFGWIITNLVAGGKLLSEMAEISSILGTAILGIVIAAYLYIGGFDAVVRTDKLQYVALIIIAAIFSFVLFSGVTVENAVNGTERIPIPTVLGFFALGILFPMGSAELWQRVYASRDVQSLKSSLIFASASYVLIGIIFSLICITIMGSIQVEGMDDSLKLVFGVKQLLMDLHPMLAAVWVVAYMSAVISSADTFVYTTASSIVQDLWERVGTLDRKLTVPRIRNVVLILVGVAALVAFVFDRIVDVTMLFVGITLVLSALGYLSTSRLTWMRLTNNGVVIVGTLGASLVIGHFIVNGGSGNILTTIIGFLSVLVGTLVLAIVRRWMS